MRIPVIVLAGFLGSGKTTLLNHLLTGPTRVGVIVNDFGSVNVDAMAVAGQVDSMISLGNGCLCCAVDTDDLDEMLGRLARPDGPVDVIVIEASGVAEPQAMVRMVLGSANPVVEYGGLVMVVDAAEFESSLVRHPQVGKHLAVADLVVVNKVDRVDVSVLAEVVARVERAAPGRPITKTSYGRVDPDLLFDRADVGSGPRQLTLDDLRDEGAHLHEAFSSVTFSSERPLHPVRLMRFLDERPAGLFRVKGSVHFGARDRFDVQAVGNYLRFDRSRRRTELVLIGTDLDVDAVVKELDGCVCVDGEQVGESDLLAVVRYLRS